MNEDLHQLRQAFDHMAQDIRALDNNTPLQAGQEKALAHLLGLKNNLRLWVNALMARRDAAVTPPDQTERAPQ